MTDIDMDAVIAELRKGWGSGELEDADGNVCLLGAACRAAGTLGRDRREEDATIDLFAPSVVPAIREQFPERVHPGSQTDYWTVSRFNDHRDTTLDDVILVCEKARAAQSEVRP